MLSDILVRALAQHLDCALASLQQKLCSFSLFETCCVQVQLTESQSGSISPGSARRNGALSFNWNQVGGDG